MIVIKRALLSCHSKIGLEAFARALSVLKIELIASGGTAEFLTRQDLKVTTVESFAGISEQLDGRVKTLHPKIFAGILAKRTDPTHIRLVGTEGLIDLVVVNLYPFQEISRRPNAVLSEVIEQIDVGGVALLRAAAKNFDHVGVLCDIRQYPPVEDALQQGSGSIPESLTRQLAVEAFDLTSRYDRAIADYLSTNSSLHAESLSDLPKRAVLTLSQRESLRYGENPHQRAGWYVAHTEPVWGLGTITQLQGKELSYNNLLDTDAAFSSLLEFADPTCVIIKHTSPCGVASAPSIVEAFVRAYEADPESAFGGVIALNRPLDAATAKLIQSFFCEVIVTPSVEPDALTILAEKTALRIVTLEFPTTIPPIQEWRQLSGSWLMQDRDQKRLLPSEWKCVTHRKPSQQELSDLVFAWKAVKHVKSNGIVIACKALTWGIGQGQTSRIGSVLLAVEKAKERLREVRDKQQKEAQDFSHEPVVASDGFFPFPDGVELLAKAGLEAIVQPGGSIRDSQVIEAANRADIAMMFTGKRHFRH